MAKVVSCVKRLSSVSKIAYNLMQVNKKPSSSPRRRLSHGVHPHGMRSSAEMACPGDGFDCKNLLRRQKQVVLCQLDERLDLRVKPRFLLEYFADLLCQ